MFSSNSRLAFWKIAVVVLCLAVFLFGTHARLVQYQTLPSNVATVGASKLWVSDHRMEIQSALEVVVLVLLAILSWVFLVSGASLRPLSVVAIPVPITSSVRWHLQRFFRPPPAL